MFASSAWAHVTVNPREAQKDGFAKLAFRVPNERDNAGTVKLEGSFPTDHPIAFVSVRPHQGWNYTVEKSKLATPITNDGEETTEAVSKITWIGGPIKPGEFDEFEVSAGPLPEDTDQLVFKALQTYEGGEVVRWIDDSTFGEGEPEHPAPVLKLLKAQNASTSSATTNDGDNQVTVKGVASQDDVDNASRLGVIGIIVGALGLIVAVVALIARRSAA